MADGLIWCSTPHATVGLVVQDGAVSDCPPYARKWRPSPVGRPARTVWRELARRGADLAWVSDG